MLSPPAAYKMRIICVNMAFQTPNSNLCKRSGTSIEWKSNPKDNKRSENAFCTRNLSSCWNGLHIRLSLTHVGTKDVIARYCWSALLTKLIPRSKIHFPASSIIPRQVRLSTRFFAHVIVSLIIPRRNMSGFSTRQRGHGQRPRCLIQARRILHCFIKWV